MKNLVDWFTPKIFFWVSLGVVGYFCLLFLNAYVVKSDFVLIGIFQEMWTLPLMFLIQPGLLVFSIIHCIKEKFRISLWSFFAFLILLISNLFCLCSFFLSIPVK